MKPHFNHILKHHPKRVIGIDEAGRGPLAGPVVAAAIYIPSKPDFEVNDSKKLSEARRESLYNILTSRYQYSVAILDPKEIDEINILQATLKAMKLAADGICEYEVALIDGNKAPKLHGKEIETVIKGDAECYSIAAASIIAKVTRDRIMDKLDKEFPQYSWYKNKGYGTKDHIESIKQHGLSIHHRRSFTRRLAA